MGHGVGVQSQQELTMLAVCTVWSFLFFLVQSKFLFEMWRFRDMSWMKQRWNQQSLVAIIVLVSAYTLSRPINLWAFFMQRDTDYSDLSTEQVILKLVIIPFTIGPVSGLCLMTCSRAFNHYYLSMVAVKVGLVQWRQMLDDSLVTEDVSWFLRHKHTWGNRQYVDRICFIIWIGIVIFTVLLPLVLGISDGIVYFLVAASVSTFLGVLAYKYPAFQDEIHLRKEKIHISILITITVLVWAASLLLSGVYDWSHQKSQLRYNGTFRQMWLAFYHSPMMFAISNLVIADFARPKRMIRLCFGIEIPLTFYAMDSPIRLTASHSGTDSPMPSSTLKNIFADNLEFSEFMAHLFREFAPENMLCVLECSKFRDKVRNMQSNTLEETFGQFSSSELVFCDDVRNTRSSLVNSIQSSSDIRSIAMSIADRYLSNGDFQVNLPYSLVNSVMSDLNDPESEIDHKIFDPVIAECYRLLRESLSRFRRFD